jgi:hypothetical protein
MSYYLQMEDEMDDESVTAKRKAQVESKVATSASNPKQIKKVASLRTLAPLQAASGSSSTARQPFKPSFKPGFKPVSNLASSSTSAPTRPPGLPTKTAITTGAGSSSSTMRPPPAVGPTPQAQLQAKMQANLDAEIAKQKKIMMLATSSKAQVHIQTTGKGVVEMEPEIFDEDIELPDIASEYVTPLFLGATVSLSLTSAAPTLPRYSNSDDEDRPKKELAPWAEPGVLEEQLEAQAGLDPDEIFGAIGEPLLETMFGPRNKFRVRSSSANWATDGLTQSEALEYAKRMGHR